MVRKWKPRQNNAGSIGIFSFIYFFAILISTQKIDTFIHHEDITSTTLGGVVVRTLDL